MHPGPMNRGVEIASDVADGPDSVILEQVANGVAVRMAVLYLLAGGGEAISDERTMKRLWFLLKGGRVVDPANGHRRRARRADRRRRDREGRRAICRSAAPTVFDVPAGPASSCPASSTCTCTCASRGRSTRRRWRPARPPRWRAASPPSRACRTPTRSTIRRAVTEFILRAKRAAEANLARVYPIGAVSRGSKGEQMTEIAELKSRRLRARCRTMAGRCRRRC